jgi:hypothetical protein
VFGELGNQQQAAAALVEDAGAAQVRGGATGVGDLARQGGLQDHPQLKGRLAERMAFVTSSLAMSSVVKAVSSGSQAPS